jgi:metal iron transporter
VAGCAISILDVLLILLFYRPNGSMKGLRAFELFVAMLVLGVVVCFIIQLTLIHESSVGDVFRGYLPSSAIIEADGYVFVFLAFILELPTLTNILSRLYQACGILGATVMPHSLYLGSGIVQPRLLEYDVQKGHVLPPSDNNSEPSISSGKPQYQPSLSAINFCLKYSIIELAISLFTFALFVNSAILIVAGASLYGNDSAADASLFSIYDLLSESIAPIAGTIFALALLLSGISAGIVCTIAGQMVSEGALNWTISPWMRRLVTRSISITPSIIIAGAVGKDGLTAALNGSQVALSIALPFISAPIIYFTCRSKYMTVSQGRSRRDLLDEDEDMVSGTDGVEERRGSNEEAAHAALGEGTIMKNNWITTGFAILVWLVIACMNIANLVLLGLGK